MLWAHTRPWENINKVTRGGAFSLQELLVNMELYLHKHYQMQGAKCPADVEGASVYPNWRQLYLFYPPYESLGSTFLRGYISGMTSTALGPCFPATAACASLKIPLPRTMGKGPGEVWQPCQLTSTTTRYHRASSGSWAAKRIFRDEKVQSQINHHKSKEELWNHM